MIKITITRTYRSSDALWYESDTQSTYYDHYARRAIEVFGEEYYGTHEISDDLAYCLFSEKE